MGGDCCNHKLRIARDALGGSFLHVHVCGFERGKWVTRWTGPRWRNDIEVERLGLIGLSQLFAKLGGREMRRHSPKCKSTGADRSRIGQEGR